MRRIFIPFVFAFSGGICVAQESKQEIAYFGADSVPLCVIGSAFVAPNDGINILNNSSGNVSVSFDNFVDAQTSLARSLDLEVTLGAMCNSSHLVSVASLNGGMKSQNSEGNNSTFVSRRDYQTSIEWAGLQIGFTTDGQTGNKAKLEIDKARKDFLRIKINAPAGTLPLVAGQYSDILQINISTIQ